MFLGVHNIRFNILLKFFKRSLKFVEFFNLVGVILCVKVKLFDGSGDFIVKF